MKKGKVFWNTTAVFITAIIVGGLFCRSLSITVSAKEKRDSITLRVCNWEEYMDLGGWNEEERLLLDNGVEIFGENPMYKDFEEWYL